MLAQVATTHALPLPLSILGWVSLVLYAPVAYIVIFIFFKTHYCITTVADFPQAAFPPPPPASPLLSSQRGDGAARWQQRRRRSSSGGARGAPVSPFGGPRLHHTASSPPSAVHAVTRQRVPNSLVHPLLAGLPASADE